MIQLLATLTPLLAPAPSVASPAIAPPRAQDGGAETRWYDIRSIPTPLDTDEPGVLMGLPVTTAKHEDLGLGVGLDRALDGVQHRLQLQHDVLR